MKKIIAGLICAAMIAPAFANGGHRGGNPGYNRGGVYTGPARHYQNRHYGHGPRYGHGYYAGNPWYWAAPVIAGAITYGMIASNPPVYAPTYVERSAQTRIIDGVVHELRYVWYDDCQCNRAVWIPIQ